MNRRSELLNQLLADSIVLQQKLRHFHWRVTGPAFYRLHSLFESLYDRMAAWGDALAERHLMIGGTPIAALAEALETSDVKEARDVPAARQMVARIADDLADFRAGLDRAIAAAEEQADRGTANLLDGMADELDKELWMLRAYLQPEG